MQIHLTFKKVFERTLQSNFLEKKWIILMFLYAMMTSIFFSQLLLAQKSLQERPYEDQVKAVFLLNFIKFIEWPEHKFPRTDSPIIVGIVGDDPFGDCIDQLVKNSKVKNRKIYIKRFKRYQKLEFCHLLFLCSSEGNRAKKILNSIKDKSTLTVGDMPKFTKNGGIINFYKEGNKVRFEINLKAVRNSELKFSSKLLRLAKIINDERGDN